MGVMSRHHRNTANITREQKMKNFTAAIILLLAGSGQAQKVSIGSAAAGPDGIKLKAGTTSACPPLPGVKPPPGCNMRFAEGLIPCGDDTDCPSPGTCQNDICSSESTSAGFHVISYTSASFGPTESNSG